MKKLNILLFVSTALLIFSCNNSGSLQSDLLENNNQKTDNAVELNSSDEYRLLSLPTPVQLASVSKAYDLKFHQSFFTSLDQNIYTSKYHRAVSGGVYAVDLGCAIIYSDQTKSLEYYKHLIQIFEDLGFSRSVGYVERYQNNIESTDSLYQIFMETYNEMHQEILDYQQEETGYFLLAGCYLESLSMYSKMYNSQYKKSRKKLFNNLLSQQILFLDNLIEISNTIDITEPGAKELEDLLLEIQQRFDAYAVEMDNDKLVVNPMPSHYEVMTLDSLITDFKMHMF